MAGNDFSALTGRAFEGGGFKSHAESAAGQTTSSHIAQPAMRRRIEKNHRRRILDPRRLPVNMTGRGGEPNRNPAASGGRSGRIGPIHHRSYRFRDNAARLRVNHVVRSTPTGTVE